jgi:hypothetical protein
LTFPSSSQIRMNRLEVAAVVEAQAALAGYTSVVIVIVIIRVVVVREDIVIIHRSCSHV